MATPERTACPLARDLFIPYLAGEVSPDTKAWLERHLAECDECRAALASAADGVPPRPAAAAEPGRQPEPTTDEAWRQLLRRVRGRNRLITAVLLLALVVTIWAISGGIRLLNAWGALPLLQPVPAATVTPSQAVGVDLTSLGLTRSGVTETGDGAMATWTDATGTVITIEARHFRNTALAHEGFLNWQRTHPVVLAAMYQYERVDRSMSMFHDLRKHFYAWQTDDWLVVISVPNHSAAPHLCASIRDALFAAYAVESSVPPGASIPK